MANSDWAGEASDGDERLDGERLDDIMPPWTGTDRRAPTRLDGRHCAREQLLTLTLATLSERGRARLTAIYDMRVVYSALFDLGFISDPRDAAALGPHPIYDNPSCRAPEFAAALEAVDPCTSRRRADLLALIACAPDADSREYLQCVLDFRLPDALDSPVLA